MLLAVPCVAQVCGAVLGKGCGAWQEINDWLVEVSREEPVIRFYLLRFQLPAAPKPPVEDPQLPPEVRKQFVNFLSTSKGTPSKKILHLTDVHVDLNYMEGAEADCGWVVVSTP